MNNISKEKQEFSKWIMRQYFDNEKNINSPWYCASVNQSNVLKEIKQKNISRFPYNYEEIHHMWKLIQSVKKAIGHQPKEVKLDEEQNSKTKYQTGEVSLKDIGKEINGGITPTMINNILFSGMNKMKKITNGISIENMDAKEFSELNEKIMKARTDTSKTYSKELVKAEGNIPLFFKELSKKKILSNSESKHTSAVEIDALKYISNNDKDVVQQILLDDIEQQDNIFKTFQSAVSKKAFYDIN